MMANSGYVVNYRMHIVQSYAAECNLSGGMQLNPLREALLGSRAISRSSRIWPFDLATEIESLLYFA